MASTAQGTDRRIPTEHQEQSAVCQWLNAHRILYAAIANGSHLAGSPKQRAIQMARLKREGLRPGMPDIFLISAPPGHPEARCWVEMKRSKGGRLSLAQAERHEVLRKHGDIVIVAHGAGEAIDALQQLGFGRLDQ